MPAFQVEVPHALGQPEATARLVRYVERVFEKYADQISAPQGGWEGSLLTYDFRTYGMHITGKMEVGEINVRVNGNLPLAAMLFKGKVEQSVRTELTRVLGPRDEGAKV